MVKTSRGYTLVELLAVSAILALLFSLGSTLLMKINTFTRLSVGKMETQRDLRNLMTLLTMEIRSAQASTVILSQEDNAQPPYSKMYFLNLNNKDVTIWQSGKTLFIEKDKNRSTLSKNTRCLFFSYPCSGDPALITVMLTVEKTDGTGRAQSLQMGGETIRLMND